MANFNDFKAHGYEAVRELGANYAGGRITYLARKTDDQSLVVIKQFQFAKSGSTWDGHKAIEREIAILKQLDHPNIPKYLTTFETPDGSCIVQQYIDARSLVDVFKSQQLYTPEQVKDVISKLLEVLVYLQKTFTEPVIHRDIKPANILIDDYGNPYLIDFGGAKVNEGEGGSTVAVGTLGFMPPEQRILKFNQTTDVYSLGLTIVCWLTKTEPSQMDNIINPATNQVIGLMQQLSSYSPRFISWIEKVVQPDPRERYSNAEEALESFKPLYVKRVPKLSASTSELKFTANKLGERMSQTVTLQNDIPETLLEGWWEVAPHTSDPPHTPDRHEWIAISPRKFNMNKETISIIVDTKQLMANSLYQRKLLVHTNCEQDTYEIGLYAKTAPFPIEIEQTLWVMPYYPWLSILALLLFLTATQVPSLYIILFWLLIVFVLLNYALLVSVEKRTPSWIGAYFWLSVFASLLPSITLGRIDLPIIVFVLLNLPIAFLVVFQKVKAKRLVKQYREGEENLIKP
jgi:serine/threonine protein kinase